MQMIQDVYCLSLDRDAICHALEQEIGHPDVFALVRERCDYLFSASPVFVGAAHLQRMQALVQAVEVVLAHPHYQQTVLARAPQIASWPCGGAKGVFLGYDFHVSGAGIGLIEINTNAGGAMLNAVLARSQRACCAAMAPFIPTAQAVDRLEDRFVQMFRREWALSGTQRPLRTVAIVDEQPQAQYLYPEFLLFKFLLERHGVQTLIVDPQDVRFDQGVLHAGGVPIDLVYNRLTDFYLEAPACEALRQAYAAQAVVLTPHPRAHALYADKRNLSLLSDAAFLDSLGLDPKIRQTLLDMVPTSETVDAANAERLWADRKHLFFKPFAGYGGRAAYRGDKLTRGVWQDILAGGYIAQQIVPPGQMRIHDAADAQRIMKFDVRQYVYDGQVMWSAARVYQGQTTNFRTAGGGFAPVYALPEGFQWPVANSPAGA
ncbi:MAG: hypothetical protein KAY21_05310 [Limnohabitans sp.]|nr:hypothetical protein [Limnohabitans sp.]